MAGESHHRLITDRTAGVLPWAANLFVTGHDSMSGTDLIDPDGLRSVLARAARRWPDVTPEVAATLWWYGSSSTLALVSASHLLVTGHSPDLSPACVTVDIGDLGTIAAASSERSVSLDGAPAMFADLVGAVVSAVHTAVPGLAGPSLWAIASDSAANRALDVGSALGRIVDGVEVAYVLTSGSKRFPRPRFVDVDAAAAVRDDVPTAPAPGARRFLRRSSCCLVFEAGESKCVSCPRRTPAARAQGWAALVG